MSLSPQQQPQRSTTTSISEPTPTGQNRNDGGIARIVPLFPEAAYLNFHQWPQVKGVECVHAAEFHHPEHGQLIAYAKLYQKNNDDGSRNRGLLNEIVAFILGRNLGAPLADHAFVCLVPLAKIHEPPGWVKGLLRQNKEAVYPAFCSSRIIGGSAVIDFQKMGHKSFSEELRQWKALPIATRLDQHVTNTDRHLGNLIRTDKCTYRLFDHGRMVTARGDWELADLQHTQKQKIPDQLLNRAWPDGCPEDTVSEILFSTDYHHSALTLSLPELRWWWQRLAEPDDAAGLEKYLSDRSKDLSRMYQEAYNRLL